MRVTVADGAFETLVATPIPGELQTCAFMHSHTCPHVCMYTYTQHTHTHTHTHAYAYDGDKERGEGTKLMMVTRRERGLS